MFFPYETATVDPCGGFFSWLWSVVRLRPVGRLHCVGSLAQSGEANPFDVQSAADALDVLDGCGRLLQK